MITETDGDKGTFQVAECGSDGICTFDKAAAVWCTVAFLCEAKTSSNFILDLGERHEEYLGPYSMNHQTFRFR